MTENSPCVVTDGYPAFHSPKASRTWVHIASMVKLAKVDSGAKPASTVACGGTLFDAGGKCLSWISSRTRSINSYTSVAWFDSGCNQSANPVKDCSLPATVAAAVAADEI